MKFELLRVCPVDLLQFKKDMQTAFQLGAKEALGAIDTEILPEKDIDSSLATEGALAYKAMVDGVMSGGAIVVIEEAESHGHLHFLYVKNGMQGKGIGQKIWNEIENKHPEIVLWETGTPYFEKRNIHFYVNRCGFHIVEFFNSYHPDKNAPEETGDLDGFFRFEKHIMR